MNKGKVEQIGSPEDIFHHPANGFVMHFLGNVNIFHSRLESGQPLGNLELASPGAPKAAPVAGTTTAYIRPHELALHRDGGQANAIEGRISHVRTIGLSVRVSLITPAGPELQVELPKEEFLSLGLSKGDTAFAVPKGAKIFEDDYSI
jgi:sulfate transport system ATP-binding protein